MIIAESNFVYTRVYWTNTLQIGFLLALLLSSAQVVVGLSPCQRARVW